MVQIKIAGLKDGEHNYSFDEPVENGGLSEPFIDNFKLDVKLSKLNHQMVTDNKLRLKAKFECDRCSSEYETELTIEYKMVYLFTKEVEETEDLNTVYMNPEADKIDLTPEIIDYSIISVPMKKLCKEDCKGLCAGCGKDLNVEECACTEQEIDSRWKPLQELKNKLNNNITE